jgi:hypothetical protein
MATQHYALLAVGVFVSYFVFTRVAAYIEAVRFA